MRDINRIMPKIPNMQWGAVTNFWPTNQRLRIMDKALPHDKRWHTVFDTPHSTIIDDVPIVKKKKESMT